MIRAYPLILCLATLLACGDDPTTVVVVRVDARSGITGISELVVEVSNDDAQISDSFAVSGKSFPLTFTVTPKGRSGQLGIAVRGRDAAGIERGRGAASTTIVEAGRADVDVLLDPSDFVVNTKITGSQRLTFVPEENAKQVALNPADGSFAVVFEDDCGMLSRCDIFMRLFNADGTPRVNQVNMDDTAFIANLTNDQTRLGPAVAFNSGKYFVVWGGADAIRGVMITADGAHATGSELEISSGAMQPGSASVAALAAGGFVVTWSEWSTLDIGNVVRGRFYTSTGAALPNPITADDGPFPISIDESVLYSGTSAAGAASNRAFAVVFRDDDNVFVRFFDEAGLPTTASEIALTNHATSAALLAPHVVWSADRFIVSWGVWDQNDADLDPGVLQLAQFAAPTGTRESPVVTLATADGSFFSFASPAVAVRNDGLLVACWHNCGAAGDGDGCGIKLQLLRSSGLRLGTARLINTTTVSAQVTPALAVRDDAVIAAWTDSSQQAPDTSNDAVRARLVFVDAALNDGEIGARCGRPEDAVCTDGLVCIAGSEGVPYCHVQCDPNGPAPQCPAGGVCTTVADTSGCVF